MKTAPAIPKATPSTAARGGAKPRRRLSTDQANQLLVVGAAAGVVLVVAIGVYTYFSYAGKTKGAPRLNEPPATIARFIGTPQFDQLSYDRQRVYMKELSGKRKELEAQFAANQLTRPEWEDALAVLWLGKQFKHIDHYNSLGPFEKKPYLDELINDDIQDDAEDDAKPKGAPKKDKDKIKAMVARFPENDRQAYDAFRRALKDRQKDREHEAKAAAKAAKAQARAAATRPTTRSTTD